MAIISRFQITKTVKIIKNLTRPVTTSKFDVKYDAEPITINGKPWNDIPGPFSLPLFGCVLHFIPRIGSLGNKLGYELSDLLYKKYGPIVKIEGFLTTPNCIFLYDPEAMSQVLRGENELPVRPGFQSVEYYRKVHRKIMHPGTDTTYNGTTGLVTEHGVTWKQFRAIVNPILMKPQTIKLYSSAVDEVALDMVKRIKSLRDSNNMILKDFDVEMSKWALEAVGVVAMGIRFCCLASDLPEDSPARQLIQSVHDIHNIGQLLDFKPSLWRYFATPTFKKAMQIYDKQMSLNTYFVKQAMGEIAKNKEHSNQNKRQEKAIIEKLLEINENVAIIMASDLLFAGVDTASNTMLATLYLLATNPEKQETLRQEILSEAEHKPYLRACIKESIRVMPVVSGNVRLTTKEYNLCGYVVPKNTTIVFGHEYVTSMEEQYPRAKEYIPERWLVNKDHPLYYRNSHQFAYSPFGYGVRQCVGKRIAYLELEALVTRVVQNFRLSWNGPAPSINSTSLNYFYGPFSFVFDDLYK